ncbi:hypothetical protein [uncultured Thalassospira sp.]|jgi:hypothetical protein|uniref:hypothetical protein n=1 Tax=uncultured Thalassospira sp. TaxID=404382 RepID=UPI0030D9BE03|tara:strand:+ start:4017 stop:4475 length:459 start_codon:yes stop_codon:yes gene_type:complete
MTGKYSPAALIQAWQKHMAGLGARYFRPITVACGLSIALAGTSGCSNLDSSVASATGTELLTAAQWFVALDVVSIINTDKTIVDHIVSASTGRDCSTVRSSMGEPYCKTDPIPEPPLYCYRTLASVTCYATPDPYNTGKRTVDWPPTRGRSL